MFRSLKKETKSTFMQSFSRETFVAVEMRPHEVDFL